MTTPLGHNHPESLPSPAPTADAGAQLTAQLRRLVLLAPVLSAVLLAVIYGLDPNRLDPTYDHSFYPVHGWSTTGVIAGWCLLLAGLAAVAPSMVSRWVAGISGLAIIAGPSNPGAAEIALRGLGFLGCALLLLLASATLALRHYRWKGRVAWSIGLSLIGAAAASSLGYPSNPFLDHPARQLLGSLLASPIFIGFGSLWVKLDRPVARLGQSGESSDLRSDVPATFVRRFLAGFLGWLLFAVVGSSLLGIKLLVALIWPSSNTAQAVARVIADWSYPECVLILQIVPTAIRGQTLGQLIAGLHVVRVDNGSAPGWLRSVVRFAVFQSIPILGFIYFMSWGLSIRYGLGSGVPDRLAWDHASGTVVVTRRPASTAKRPSAEKLSPEAKPPTWRSFE